VNPLIIGNFNTEYKADSGLDAISQFWNDLSPHITNNVPQLYVTLQDGTNNLLHYKISEKLVGGSKMTDFNISEFKLDLTQSQKNNLLEQIKKVENKITKQVGGLKHKPERSRHKDSSSSSSSSSLDSDDENDYYNFKKYRSLTQPIAMWYYTPSIYRVNSMFVPTFTTPIVPYVKLWLPML